MRKARNTRHKRPSKAYTWYVPILNDARIPHLLLRHNTVYSSPTFAKGDLNVDSGYILRISRDTWGSIRFSLIPHITRGGTPSTIRRNILLKVPSGYSTGIAFAGVVVSTVRELAQHMLGGLDSGIILSISRNKRGIVKVNLVRSVG